MNNKFSLNCIGDNSTKRKWSRKISWSLLNNNPNLDWGMVMSCLRKAFLIWQDCEYTDVAFVEKPPGELADIRIYWDEFTDNPLFGWAEYPPENGIYEPDAGKIKLNLNVRWTDTERGDGDQPIDLVTLAAHEIGHAIGIEHSMFSVENLMHYIYSGSHRYLGEFDAKFYGYLYYGDPRPNKDSQ